MNWELQEFNQWHYGNYYGKTDRPKQFDEMKTIATELSRGFDHVRVDLYSVDDAIYFGEMTFTNGSGLEEITPYSADLRLGSYWTLNKLNRKNIISKYSIYRGPNSLLYIKVKWNSGNVGDEKCRRHA